MESVDWVWRVIDLVLAYGAGLLTLINPCVLPVLPLVLGAALRGGRSGPLVLAAGMSIAFVAVGMLVLTVGTSIGLDQERLSQVGAGLMIAFGTVLLVPQLNARFALAAGRFAATADSSLGDLDQSRPQELFLGGMLLGAVWSPCIGPTLGGAISLAAQGQDLAYATAIMASFAVGVSTVIVALGYGTSKAIQARRDWLRPLAERSRPILGGVFLVVGVAILLKLHQTIEAWLLDHMPYWLQDLSVSL